MAKNLVQFSQCTQYIKDFLTYSTMCSFIVSVETVSAIIVVNTFRENLQSLRMSDAADVQDLKGGHAPAQKVRQIYFILFKVVSNMKIEYSKKIVSFIN